MRGESLPNLDLINFPILTYLELETINLTREEQKILLSFENFKIIKICLFT